MSVANWKRVSRTEPCPICEKPDWCMVAVDKSVVICARIASEKPAGSKGAGWIHQLSDPPFRHSGWRTAKRRNPRRDVAEIRRIADQCLHAAEPKSIDWLGEKLGVEPWTLRRLSVGVHRGKRAFAFPMREPNGAICGIRYRALSGSKFSETGSREGLFFAPEEIDSEHLIIVEGASDSAAMMSLGYSSCVGRASCRGNIDQLVTLCRRNRFNHVIVVPDNDGPGIEGAEGLIDRLNSNCQIVRLAGGLTDVRQCIQQKENADWLAGQIGKLIGASQQGATSHDDLV